jgi:hypothetical protein
MDDGGNVTDSNALAQLSLGHRFAPAVTEADCTQSNGQSVDWVIVVIFDWLTVDTQAGFFQREISPESPAYYQVVQHGYPD